jgi:hypothetical protein
MKARAVLNLIDEVVKDAKDRWRVSVDAHTRSFTVFRGSEDICAGYYDPGTKRINDLEFMDPNYRKNNKTRVKAIGMVKKTFPDYK